MKIGNPGLGCKSTTIVRKRREALSRSRVWQQPAATDERLARGIHYSYLAHVIIHNVPKYNVCVCVTSKTLYYHYNVYNSGPVAPQLDV